MALVASICLTLVPTPRQGQVLRSTLYDGTGALGIPNLPELQSLTA